MPAIVTRQSLQAMLDQADEQRRQQIIGRALVVLFERQTEAEKQTNDTKEDNGVGFAGCDAKSGTLTAKYFLKHRALLDWQVEKWLKRGSNGFYRICKYAGQLNEAAVARAARNQVAA
jgi:hypothetical protein